MTYEAQNASHTLAMGAAFLRRDGTHSQERARARLAAGYCKRTVAQCNDCKQVSAIYETRIGYAAT